MFICPTCLENTEEHETTIDPDEGKICVWCAEEFQYKRDEMEDMIRKAEKENYDYDEDN